MANQHNYRNMITDRLNKQSNKALLELVYEYLVLDDNCGHFTRTGYWCRDELKRVLEERLVACGFIEQTLTA